MFIIVDGLDGSGKSTVVKAWNNYLAAAGNGIFDLKNYLKNHDHYPELSEIKSYDFISSCEPTDTGIGKVIREELIKTGTNYPVQAVADAYALDRLVLYTKIIIPLLRDGRCIFQDRGISSSLAYQSVSDSKLTLKKISSLPGNALALRHRPDYLIIVDTKPKNCLNRLNHRAKKDNVIFEKLNFMTKLEKIYHSRPFLNLFKKHGTNIIFLNGNVKADIMEAEAIKILKTILK